ncbi:MAG: GNAT family N-acetyltransferase [Kiritimatiellae bacterium]|jgi:ribosomal protein S18 acetylase RimI-like enzyme|nr:GNAT family N-acetyltransferase [Kiritimatiellia bacterium]
MITIRRIRQGEGALLRDLRLQALKNDAYAFGSTYESAIARSLDSWNQQADSTAEGSLRATFIAFRHHEPIAISAIYKNEGKKNEAEVLQVWITPEFRGSGLANKMMDSVFGWAEDNGYTNVTAEDTQINQRALSFYLNYGFEKISESDSASKMEKPIKSNPGCLPSSSDGPNI